MILETVLTGLLTYYYHQLALPSSRAYPSVRNQVYEQIQQPSPRRRRSTPVLRQPSTRRERTRQVLTPERGALTVTTEPVSGGTVPPGAQRITMLIVRFTASCEGDVTVEGIGLWRRGLGNRDDIAAVYATNHGQRVSNARPISRRDGFVEINMRRFTIEACHEEELHILADFTDDASVAGEHRFEIADEGAILSDATTTSLERRAGVTLMSTSTAGATQGSIAVEYLSLLRRVRFGENRTVSRIRLDIDSRDDHSLQAITFTNNGSASDEDLENLYVQSGRHRVTTIASSLEGDRVRLEFDPPFSLRQSKSYVFELRADVRVGRSKTLQFVVEEPSDIEATVVRGRQR